MSKSNLIYIITYGNIISLKIKFKYIPQSYAAYNTFLLQLITTEFSFAQELINDVNEELRKVSYNFMRNDDVDVEKFQKEIVYVSVHVRRTDYIKLLKNLYAGHVVSSRYFAEAMNMFRRKYNTNTTEVLFVMASDDSNWCKNKFSNQSDVVFTSTFVCKSSKKQPTFDLAVLAQCNHTIIRYKCILV